MVADGKASATYWMNRPKWSGSKKELRLKLSKRKEKYMIEKKSGALIIFWVQKATCNLV